MRAEREDEEQRSEDRQRLCLLVGGAALFCPDDISNPGVTLRNQPI